MRASLTWKHGGKAFRKKSGQKRGVTFHQVGFSSGVLLFYTV